MEVAACVLLGRQQGSPLLCFFWQQHVDVVATEIYSDGQPEIIPQRIYDFWLGGSGLCVMCGWWVCWSVPSRVTQCMACLRGVAVNLWPLWLSLLASGMGLWRLKSVWSWGHVMAGEEGERGMGMGGGGSELIWALSPLNNIHPLISQQNRMFLGLQNSNRKWLIVDSNNKSLFSDL